MIWLDDYERRARLVPGLWIVAPVAILVVGFGLRSSPVVSSAAGLLITAGGPVLLANFVRDQGTRIEPSLIREWGGWPTTLLLSEGEPVILQHRRDSVERATGMALPSLDSDDAMGYEPATAVLRSRTRDTDRFPLVFVENRNYGFERNTLGCRPIGIGAAVSAVVVAVVAATGLSIWADGFEATYAWTVALIALVGLFWLLYPSAGRTKAVAFKYAERLIESADELPAPEQDRPSD